MYAKQGTTWSREDEEHVKTTYGKVPTKDIAKVLQRKPMAISSKANELGCYIRGKNKPNVLHALKALYKGAGGYS